MRYRNTLIRALHGILPSLAAWLILAAHGLAATADQVPTHAGSASCATCHAGEAERWRGSDHDLAMAEATEATVLGDFRDAEISAQGVTSRF
jgi:hypothetical protein